MDHEGLDANGDFAETSILNAIVDLDSKWKLIELLNVISRMDRVYGM